MDWWIDCLLPASVIQPQALTLVTKRTNQATAFRAPVEQLSHPRSGSSGSDYARFPERIPDRRASFFPVPLPSYPPTPDSKPPGRTRLKIHLFVPSILFHVLLTFLSKFFSTFLRSTSSLSVFVSYLDLEEIYLPLYAEFPIYATLRAKEIRTPIIRKDVTGLSPSLADVSTSLSLSLMQPASTQKVQRKPAV